jgi:hypothetical protein
MVDERAVQAQGRKALCTKLNGSLLFGPGRDVPKEADTA